MSSGMAYGLEAKALALTGGDACSARRLLALIVETNRAALAQLHAGFAAATWDSVSSAAHRIAGSARMLECDGLIALLTQLEAAARGREIGTVTALMRSVADALASLDASIDAALSEAVAFRYHR
nr:Virulence sensor protein BvgS [Paraburkholderia busanensis]